MTDPRTWSDELAEAMQLVIDRGDLGVDVYEWWAATGEAISELGPDHTEVAERLRKMHGEMWDYVREFELNRVDW